MKFINNDCGMVHGNVRISSIFTNKAGEWKLGGFELLDSMKEESPMIMVSEITMVAYHVTKKALVNLEN